MQKWEYRLVSSGDVEGGGLFKGKTREALEAHLNELGQQGWEIVGVDFIDDYASEKHFFALAKRERE